jgi:hypothetical protein
MFLSEACLTQAIAAADAGQKEKWEKRLLFVQPLTAGDFLRS